MSNEPFRMACNEVGKKGGDVFVLDPDLPHVTIPGSKVMPEMTYELAVKSPVRFEFQKTYRSSGITHVISINRETGQMSFGDLDEATGFRDVNPAPESTKCTFEPL